MGQDNAMERLRHFKEQTLEVVPVGNRIKKKKFKGGPNPLSCKKKTRKPSEMASSSDKISDAKISKKKRIRKKIPKHIIQELKSQTAQTP